LKPHEETINSSENKQLSLEFLVGLSKLKADDNPVLMLVAYDFSSKQELRGQVNLFKLTNALLI